MGIFVMTQMTIRRPDDWHLHLRDGAMLGAVIDDTARHFARAIIMPNLVPPVVTRTEAVAYRDRIMACVNPDHGFTPVSKLCASESPDKLLSSLSEALHLHRPRTRDRNAENTEQPIRM